MSNSSQQDRAAFGTDVSEVRHEPPASRWRLVLYTAVLCATPFVLVAGTLWWLGSAAYVRHAQYASMAGIGYGARLRGADCDVVVDGDSTALVGVEPVVIERRTGLKTCNIAETAGVKHVNGEMVLDMYLEHNRRPRYLVFSFAPENLTRPERWDTVSLFEGYLFRMQYRPDAAFAMYVLRHPSDVTVAAELALRTGARWIFAKPMPAAMAETRERLQGQLPDEGTPLTSCPVSLILREPDTAWLAELRAKYGVGGTRVLIDVAPEPACAPDRSFYEPRLEHGVTDNAWWTLPLGEFTDSGRLHTTEAGAEAISAAIAEQIARLQEGVR